MPTRPISELIGSVLQGFSAKLQSIAGLDFTGAGLKALRVNLAGTAFELFTLTKGSVGLGNVDDTADANKPVSAATQAALDAKAAASHNHDSAYAALGHNHDSAYSPIGHGHSNATGAAAGFMSAADKGKLDGVAAGATANSPDTALLNRANHTGSQPASTISDFAEAVDDRVAQLLAQGANITLTYDDAGNLLTIASTGGGGGVWTTIVKAADEARTANTSLTVDGSLKATLGVGQHRIRLLAILSTANANMDFKYATAFTGAATVKAYRRRHITAGAAAGTDNENVAVGTGQIASTPVAATTSGIATVDIDMVLNVTAQGEFQFQWAQNTSDAAALTVLEGSTLEHAPA